MNRIFISLVMCFGVNLANAAPIVEDFTSHSYTFTGTNFETSSTGITFANNLYSHPDGFEDYQGGAYNYYGEHDMYFDFASEVSLTSIDFSRVTFGLTHIDAMIVTLFDTSGALLNTIDFTLTDTLTAIAMNTDNVSRVSIDFDGVGQNTYNDGRDHSWWFIDNIRFDTDNNLYGSTGVPAPATFLLLLAGLAGLTFRKPAS